MEFLLTSGSPPITGIPHPNFSVIFIPFTLPPSESKEKGRNRSSP